MKHLGDITKINGAAIPAVDVITGGSPCQDLSVAGARAGLDGERSGLFMDQVRIVKEMRAEEVRNGKPDHMARPRYLVWENVPGAFSSNRGADFQAVLTEIVRIAEPEAPDVPMPEKGRWSKSGCLYDEMGKWSLAWRVHDAQFWGVPQRRKRIALVADFGGLSAPEVLFERRSLLWDSCESKPKREETTAGIRSCADRASDAHRPRVYEKHAQDSRYKPLGEISAPVHAIYGTGGNNQPLVMCDILAFDTTQVTSAKNWSNPHYGDPCHPLAAQAHVPSIAGKSFIRRLTPLECERLQGYPDDWTDIGDWIDSNGKKRKAADSPRYKALGNSIALPFWKVLMKRISAQYDRDATLGSLFDGIGGFPYIWEQINGKGSAVWASEIEEFPIAVTKKRFPEDE